MPAPTAAGPGPQGEDRRGRPRGADGALAPGGGTAYGMGVLRIPPRLLDELRRHGEESYPEESCGVLLGRRRGGAGEVGEVVRCANARAGASSGRYEIDPRDLLAARKRARAGGREIVGFYHSHPDHPARPSPTDLAEAHWLGCSYVVTAVAAGRAGATASFLLAGGGEEDKHFRDEELAAAEAGPGGEAAPAVPAGGGEW